MLRTLLASGAAAAVAYYLFRQRDYRTAAPVPPEEPAPAPAPESSPAPAAPAPAAPAPAALPPDAVAATLAPAARSGLHVLHSGDFAGEVANELCRAMPQLKVHVHAMADFKKWAKKTSLTDGDASWPPLKVVFIVATIENEQPPEDAGACVRYFQRRTHADELLRGRLHYAVLGLGDSNLLLDRQTTTAKDCNQIARSIDGRMEALGGVRIHALGETDDRTGNLELTPWLESFAKLAPQLSD